VSASYQVLIIFINIFINKSNETGRYLLFVSTSYWKMHDRYRIYVSIQ